MCIRAGHNLRHFQRLMEDLRGAIAGDDWAAMGRRWPGVSDLLPGGGAKSGPLASET